MSSSAQALADLYVKHQLDLFRLDASVRTQVLNELTRMGGDVERRLLQQELSELKRAALTKVLDDVTATVDNYYSRLHGMVSDTLTGVARLEAQNLVYLQIGEGIPTRKFLEMVSGDALVQGAVVSDWWAKQSADTAFRFANEVRDGVLSGQTNQEIVQRIRGTADQAGVLDVSQRNAEALVRSSIQSVANEARLEMYRQNADVIIGVRQISTLDGRTSDICMAYSDAEWDLDGNPLEGTDLPFNGGPPRHWNCRSTLVPIMDNSVLGFDLSEGRTRASADGPVEDGTSFSSWLERQPPSVADDLLGKGRAQLWRDGNMTLSQLVDQTGRPLTLAQLEKRTAERALPAGGEEMMGVRKQGRGHGATGVSAEERAFRIRVVEEELAKLNMSEYKVDFHKGAGYAFQVGDRECRAAAYFRPQGPRGMLGFYVDSWQGGSTADSIGKIVRHESFHARLYYARTKDPDAVYGFMRTRIADLEREDGTTSYSIAYWRKAKNDPDVQKFLSGQSQYFPHTLYSAINESLAEMHATNRITTTYQSLDDIVKKLFRAPKGKPAVPTGAAPPPVVKPPVVAPPAPPQLPPGLRPVLPPPAVPPPVIPGARFSLEQLCLELNVSPKDVRRILRAAGVEKPGTMWIWPNREAAQAVIDLIKSKKRIPGVI